MTSTGTAAETILEAGFEGGKLTLLGLRTDAGLRFRIDTDEGTMFDLLSDEDRAGTAPNGYRHASEWIDSWDKALEFLNERWWHTMVALHVHPAFRERIWAAVQRRSRRSAWPSSSWSMRMRAWCRRLVLYVTKREVRADRRRAKAIARMQLDRWKRACHGSHGFRWTR
jgi:hypothetical protein